VTVSVLVPSFDERTSVRQTVAAVRAALTGAGVDHEIVVIDDGSTDGTADEAAAAGAVVLRHPVNGGYGRALKTGLRHAHGDIIAITDADGSYPADALPALIEDMSRFDMVVGARQGKHYQGSFAKWLGRRALERMVLFVTGVRVPDVNSGLRVFRKQIALDHIDQIGNGFSFTTTLTLAMLLEGHFVRYIPVAYHARLGSSKVRLRRDIARTIQILVMAILAYNPVKLFLLLTYLVVLALVPAIAVDVFVARGFHVGLILIVDASAALLLFGVGLASDLLRRLV
jgi:polyisoprenyl-phosphate glycosyltransferase